MDLLEVYRRLRRALGGREWWKAEGPWEVMVGALLTQQTTWRNVEAALSNLKAAGLMDPRALAAAPSTVVQRCVRPAGYFRAKAERLQAMARAVLRQGGVEAFLSGDPMDARKRLLGLPGVGYETADSILLYAAGAPIMVVDAYTRRIMERLGSPLPPDYEEARRSLEACLPRDLDLYREFHAVMVELGKRFCRRRPVCAPCPVVELCPHGQRATGGSP